MRNTFFFILFILIVFQNTSLGQEILVDLMADPRQKVHLKKTSCKSTLSLPFFDDFAKNTSIPDGSIWSKSSVLVNQSFGINPPTVGVTTFDAINSDGELYSSLSTSAFIADTLMSNPIDLYFPGDTNIYFSFYFQPKGLGKEPMPYDSLVLEFYNVTSDEWKRVWSASADFQNNTLTQSNHLFQKKIVKNSDTLAKTFFLVHFPVLDEQYKKTGFQFRFMNYASLPQNTQVPSLRGNGDHWNIDLVYIDKEQFYYDTLLNDIAFIKPIKSVLKNYESIPWSHFTPEAKQTELTDPLAFDISYRNLGSTTWNITRRFSVTDLSNLSEPYNFSGGAYNILPSETINYTRNYLYDFVSGWDDSAKFQMTTYLITDLDNETFPRRWNDTLTHTQLFKNYYAYDDGSAENGYGLYGEGSSNGMVALKYHAYRLDSLKGVSIYFNQIYNDTRPAFVLTVWADNNGKPGSKIFEEVIEKPTLSYNQDTLYPIKDLIKVEGDFYIGWMQTTEDLLNVGFDLNRVHNNRLFYNLDGNWLNSQFEGSLMIRPYFGKTEQAPASVKNEGSIVLDVYPNPAIDQLNIRFDGTFTPMVYRIINFTGQIVSHNRLDSQSIDIGDLSTGVYILQVYDRDGLCTSRKFIVSR